ncbi:hypothetical protein DRJ53_19520 [Paracnuella aquatica]|nr:hypothetical protein DRJ53_19520 [Paracnuella aquatica]
MKAFVKSGNRFGQAPVGYDHYGPRVRDGRFLSQKQRIEINEDGKLLREAWEWKLSGLYSDSQILSKLQSRGLILSKQKISKIWRNPFYCGILINRLAEEPVKGNWKPIVTIEEFVKVQKLLENNPSGYQQNKAEEMRPLTRLLKCDQCGSHMVGYENKQKGLHYYRCLKCNGVSINAHATPKARRKSAEELFIQLLEQFSIPEKLRPLVELQLKKIFNHYNEAGGDDEEQKLQTQLAVLQKQVKQLKIRYGLGQIDQETYALTLEHLGSQEQQISRELELVVPKISNLEKLLEASLDKLAKVSTIWSSADLEGKRRVQKVLFPEGVLYNVKNHTYLTSKVNPFVELTVSFTREDTSKKEATSPDFEEKSLSVPRSRLELPTFGL